MLHAIAEVIVEVVFWATGHGILWLLTLGHLKRAHATDTLTVMVGLIFWSVLGTGLVLVLNRQ